MNKLTKQGVRDLNTPKNGKRKAEKSDACFHNYQPIVDTKLYWVYGISPPKTLKCEKCGDEI